MANISSTKLIPRHYVQIIKYNVVVSKIWECTLFMVLIYCVFLESSPRHLEIKDLRTYPALQFSNIPLSEQFQKIYVSEASGNFRPSRHLLNAVFSNSHVFHHGLIIQNPAGAHNAKPQNYPKSNKWMLFFASSNKKLYLLFLEKIKKCKESIKSTENMLSYFN